MTTWAARFAIAATAALGAACQDLPLMPHWDADWNVPLPTQNISLSSAIGFFVAPGATATIGFDPQRHELTGAIGRLLRQELTGVSVVLTIRKALPVGGLDTLFIAADSLGLRDSTATRIVVPVEVRASDLIVSDTAPVSAAGLAMLQGAARQGGSVWVQLRGLVSYEGPGPLTVTAADSVHVRVSMLATIAVSR